MSTLCVSRSMLVSGSRALFLPMNRGCTASKATLATLASQAPNPTRPARSSPPPPSPTPSSYPSAWFMPPPPPLSSDFAPAPKTAAVLSSFSSSSATVETVGVASHIEPRMAGQRGKAVKRESRREYSLSHFMAEAEQGKVDEKGGKKEVKVCTKLVMLTGGRNQGRVGTIVHRERHLGGYDIVHVRDVLDREFATRLSNVFIIGQGNKALVALPKGKGVKLSISEERDQRRKQAEKRA
ncbi:hypothetical protein JCM10207_008896 [Rhodosporidiobolus poonsookiae]